MHRRHFLTTAARLALAAAVAPAGRTAVVNAASGAQPLIGRVVAIGIPGVAAVSSVGTFLPGGPFHDNPVFAASTQPGRILDPARILVTSISNFGAPLARADQRPGSILSLDPSGAPMVIPPSFAIAGTQASTLGGRAQLFSAQSSAFRNGVNTPGAVTADYTGVSNPLGLSLNNAFGRIWPANAPTGLAGPGTSTILDPSGAPLAHAPDPVAGGVFAGTATNRQPQQIPGGIATGAVGTALLGRAPDGSGKAVFAVVTADGAVAQAQTLRGVDGLAPAGTISPLRDSSLLSHDVGLQLGGLTLGLGVDVSLEGEPRVGVVLNYEPSRILYMTDPLANAVVALALADNGVVFTPGPLRRLAQGALNQPIDLAPAESETTDPNWASNTTVSEGADLYVANRGDNTIVRLRQDGTVAAVRRVALPAGDLGTARLNGIGVSPDGSTIWATISGTLPGFTSSGAVLALPAFGG